MTNPIFRHLYQELQKYGTTIKAIQTVFDRYFSFYYFAFFVYCVCVTRM